MRGVGWRWIGVRWPNRGEGRVAGDGFGVRACGFRPVAPWLLAAGSRSRYSLRQRAQYLPVFVHDVLSGLHLPLEFRIVRGEPITAVGLLDQIERIAFFDAKLRHHLFREDDAGRRADSGDFDREHGEPSQGSIYYDSPLAALWAYGAVLLECRIHCRKY